MTNKISGVTETYLQENSFIRKTFYISMQNNSYPQNTLYTEAEVKTPSLKRKPGLDQSPSEEEKREMELSNVPANFVMRMIEKFNNLK